MVKDYGIESSTWNIAADFVKWKVTKPLIEFDEMYRIASYGSNNLPEEFLLNDDAMIHARAKGLRRMQTILKMLIGNVEFAIKTGDKDTVKEQKTALVKLEKYIPKAFSITTNQKQQTRNLNIKEPIFDKIKETLLEIHNNLLEPMNKAELIFGTTDQGLSREDRRDMMRADNKTH